MPVQLSASSLNRAKRCPASHALPSVSEDTRAGIAGTITHGVLRRLGEGWTDEAAREWGNHAVLASTLTEGQRKAKSAEITALVANRSQVPVGDTEVPLAYSVVTRKGRVMPRTKDRDYRYELGEIPGTADVVGWGNGEVLVCDFKSEHTAYEDHTLQLNFYALAACRESGASSAECRVIGYSDSGHLAVTASWVLDWEDLLALEEELLQIRDRVEHERAKAAQGGYTPDVTLGDHCRYCPAWRACPAYSGAIKTVTNSESEDLGQAYISAQMAEQAAEAVRRLVHIRLESEGIISLGDGRSIVLDRAGRTRIKKDATSAKAKRVRKSAESSTATTEQTELTSESA